MPPQAVSGGGLAASDLSGALNASLWVMLAAILAVAGMYLATRVKRWSRRDQSPEAFTLQDLREMRARSEISEAEYSRLRAALLASSEVIGETTDSGPDEEVPPDGVPEPPND